MSFRAKYGGLRSADWLRSFRYGPTVTAFRNLESGQVVFTQTLIPQQFYIDRQFKYHNWQNKKPTLRKDIWRPLAVAEVESHEQAVRLYKDLVKLRHMRDFTQKDQARAWRRRSAEGNIWFWNQYRPTYTHEAVSDIISALHAADSPARIFWDHEFRKGSEAAWQNLKVEHSVLPRHNPREQSIVLNRIRVEALNRSLDARNKEIQLQSAEDEAAAAEGRLTSTEIARAERELWTRRAESAKQARAVERATLLDARPDLQALEARQVEQEEAQAALAEAVAAFDHTLPPGQRSAAWEPIKLRKMALRRAKRLVRQAKRRVAARTIKRRVAQPRVRLNRK